MEKIDEINAYEKTYTIRAIGGGFSVSVPKEVVERKAKENGISVKKFKDRFAVKMLYDDFPNVDGAFKFVKKEEEE